jgi:DNA polymerase-3 subunit gamma/tau
VDIGPEKPPFIAEPLEDPFAPAREPTPAEPAPRPAEQPEPVRHRAVRAGLPGPSRPVRVEPVTIPEPLRGPERDAPPAPPPKPEKDPIPA